MNFVAVSFSLKRGRFENSVTIQSSMQDVMKALSSSTSWVGANLPLMPSAIASVCSMEVASGAAGLKNALVDFLSLRIKILL